MDYEKESIVLKALGHPVRLRLVEGLLRHECSVNDIAEKVGLPQSTISQHLGILKTAGVITPKKYGVRTCYQVTHKTVQKIIRLLQ